MDDPVERELQDLLARTAPDGHLTPTLADRIRAEYGRQVRTLYVYPRTGAVKVALKSGKSILFDRDGTFVLVDYPGVRGVLARIADVFTFWLPARLVPWLRP